MAAESIDLVIDGFYRAVGRRVREVRDERARLTQSQLAAQVGLTRSSIANLEAGRQRIPLHLLAWIAEVLGVPMVSLLPEEGLGGIAANPRIAELAEAPSSTRDFVEGAIAQLGLVPKGGSRHGSS